jgi:hypothetical protein
VHTRRRLPLGDAPVVLWVHYFDCGISQGKGFEATLDVGVEVLCCVNGHMYVGIKRRHDQGVRVHVQEYPLRHDIGVRRRGVGDVLEKTENKEVRKTKIR